MTTRTNAENVRQYKSKFSLIVEQISVFTLSTNLGKLRICLKISNEWYYNYVLHYTELSFG